MTTPLLAARGLAKRFGAVIAADDVTIEIAAGERVSLIGSNGAGKTTFVNMVTGYLKPDAGAIQLDGSDITRASPREIARLGICRSFQIPQLVLDLSVLDNLLVAVAAAGGRPSLWRPADAARERAQALLGRFGLQAQALQPAGELAGGMRKLLDIAMALARSPRLLLLDEPTSGVSADEKVSAMQRVMDALSHEQVTIAFVEHDMDIVEQFSERVIAFAAGRVIADGAPHETLANADVRRMITGTA